MRSHFIAHLEENIRETLRDVLRRLTVDSAGESATPFMLPLHLRFLDVGSVDIPAKVLNELGLITTLLFATAVDLRAGWAPFVWATDGAETFGYGGARASCHPDTTKYLASFVHIEGHQFVSTDIFDNSDVTNPFAVEMPMRYRAFRQKISQRSTKSFHASKLEAGALGIAVHTITRQVESHRQRVLLLVDAKVLLFAARKGRSSAPNFIHGLKGIAAVSLAADLRMHFGYIASSHNPGDPPAEVLSTSVAECEAAPAANGLRVESHLCIPSNVRCADAVRVEHCLEEMPVIRGAHRVAQAIWRSRNRWSRFPHAQCILITACRWLSSRLATASRVQPVPQRRRADGLS